MPFVVKYETNFAPGVVQTSPQTFDTRGQAEAYEQALQDVVTSEVVEVDDAPPGDA